MDLNNYFFNHIYSSKKGRNLHACCRWQRVVSRLIAGTFVLVSVILGFVVSEYFFYIYRIGGLHVDDIISNWFLSYGAHFKSIGR